MRDSIWQLKNNYNHMKILSIISVRGHQCSQAVFCQSAASKTGTGTSGATQATKATAACIK